MQPEKISRTCPKIIQKYPKYIRNMSEHMSQTCPTMSETCPKHLRTCPKHIRKHVPHISEHIRKVSENASQTYQNSSNISHTYDTKSLPVVPGIEPGTLWIGLQPLSEYQPIRLIPSRGKGSPERSRASELDKKHLVAEKVFGFFA